MLRKLAFALIALVTIEACSKVPISGRRQMNLLPEDQLVAMGTSQYREVLQQNQIVTGTADAAMVAKVGARIAEAATTYLKSKNKGDRVAGYKWEYNLIQSPEVNAWCMPGGKIAVYTGILPYTQTEAGLATVIAHEVSHAVARHGNERLSQALLAQAGGMALDVYLSQHPSQSSDLYRQAYGAGVTVGALLPFSRLQESEADELGLIFMAIAGYNPQEAVDFWQRMSQANNGNKPPEFLSTHPSDASRIAAIKKKMPTAMRYYERYNGGTAPVAQGQ
jgi:predicted Zn-dependent protease